MGFKDASWAYGLALPMMQKVVLAAVCFATDDKTHETIVGQGRIASMTGASVDSVRRALRELEAMGAISRSRRAGAGGYRTSDLTVVDPTFTAHSPVGRAPSRQSAYKAERRNLTGAQPSPTGHGAGAEEIIQIDHPEDHPVNASGDLFDEFYAIWPKKVNKPAARRAWDKAVTKCPAEEILAAAVAYRDNPGLPEEQFIPYPATWLNGERWNDDLPESATQASDDRKVIRGGRVVAPDVPDFGVEEWMYRA
ncbi:hypothetical protein EDM22_12295 [Agromyces tardus]|uniref:Helix-turn-helix domain-containing protein n=1 Tax=Agromyces tardus TaxID=2583849 RepID=A0A3M8A8F7_9MICO|nr:helix-turn-helix domain-containing protein [Agromyces tardus]RNB47404.1 hypothetical protein EDM22_12295 [Agromyces tardus]